MTSPVETEPGVSSDVAILLDFVADRDVPCPVCDYSLRALTSPRCPECGAPLMLQIGSPQLRVGAWALAMVSFALALGFDGVVSIGLVTVLVLEPAPFWQPYGIVTLFVALAGGMLGGLLRVARRRSAWTKRTMRAQWLWAGVVFAVVGVVHAVVGVGFLLIAN
jgi:hypothetical protein